jgi:hypothetical protein
MCGGGHISSIMTSGTALRKPTNISEDLSSKRVDKRKMPVKWFKIKADRASHIPIRFFKRFVAAG